MKKELTVKVGTLYKRRDGLKAFVYYRSPVSNMFRAAIVGNPDNFSVYENGKESKFDESQNDLVEIIK